MVKVISICLLGSQSFGYTSKQTLTGVGRTYVQKNSKVGDLCGQINEKLRFAAGTPLKLYEVCTLLLSSETTSAYTISP